MLEEITEANFAEKVIDSPKPSVIDFGSEFCAPCGPVERILEKLSGEYDSKINFFKVDIVENRELTERLEIYSIPYIIFYRDENHINSHVGTAKEETFEENIEALLGG